MCIYILIYIIGYILSVIMFGYIISLENNITLGGVVAILLISSGSWITFLTALISITKVDWDRIIIKKNKK